MSLLLRHATLQPHRCRYWKTPTLNGEFVALASPVLWCYAQIERLTRRNELVARWDEKPSLQALERPSQPMRPGQIVLRSLHLVVDSPRHAPMDRSVLPELINGLVERST